jgi:hypothetical protein
MSCVGILPFSRQGVVQKHGRICLIKCPDEAMDLALYRPWNLDTLRW